MPAAGPSPRRGIRRAQDWRPDTHASPHDSSPSPGLRHRTCWPRSPGPPKSSASRSSRAWSRTRSSARRRRAPGTHALIRTCEPHHSRRSPRRRTCLPRSPGPSPRRRAPRAPGAGHASPHDASPSPRRHARRALGPASRDARGTVRRKDVRAWHSHGQDRARRSSSVDGNHIHDHDSPAPLSRPRASRRDASRDTSRDTSRVLWLASPPLGIPLGILAGDLTEDSTTGDSTGDTEYSSRSQSWTTRSRGDLDVSLLLQDAWPVLVRFA